MELIGIELAKVVSIFLVSNPGGQPILGRMGIALQERYQFAVHPTTIEQMLADKIEFGQGSYGEARIDLLEIFQDGVVVTARSPTKALEEFIEDLVSWAHETFGLMRVETQTVNRAYESHLLIKSEIPLLVVSDALKGVQSAVKKLLFASTKIDVEYEPFGFSFGPDITKIASMKPSRFVLERRVGPSFESNLYFSIAPLRTTDHLKVLEMIENSMRQLQ